MYLYVFVCICMYLKIPLRFHSRNEKSEPNQPTPATVKLSGSGAVFRQIKKPRIHKFPNAKNSGRSISLVLLKNWSWNNGISVDFSKQNQPTIFVAFNFFLTWKEYTMIHLLLFVRICVYLFIFVCICMYLFVFVCICMYLYVFGCICNYLYVFVCICMYL